MRLERMWLEDGRNFDTLVDEEREIKIIAKRGKFDGVKIKQMDILCDFDGKVRQYSPLFLAQTLKG